MSKVGAYAHFAPKGSTTPEVLAAAGRVKVTRELGDGERDLAEVGQMFEVEHTGTGTGTGACAHAFPDELDWEGG
ncbi:hypothetical protein H7J07_04915 [Mycobacterium koreense]|uniref:Uncharacterized protein n=1 Tax=Mycolicibacillus koreensis TaxID=1069220 RepID=A0A7I7SAR2_9MYCO|nr:hypothetical protein [Mycolicibacillus koreensis]MCV7247599.1 hypothetical protein [Mycolicibacillus koreensis]OSC32825.1 hypothetical protein B8W67_13985 [Mycolicibacillus koreensis]BBY53977.1 hypothetical protein MKOR_12280 [Mycolicibacillus koreensis]